MSNITKKKLEQLKFMVLELEKYLKENFAPSHLFLYLDELKQKISEKPFGLVFEEYLEPTENIDAKLVEQCKLRIGNNKKINQLIEGENLHVLKILKQNYNGGIDVICIDPPYNTGMNWLNYDDHTYLEKEDSYTHSKWLSFIKKRLDIAYELLTETGVIFININENEIGNLLLLCYMIFGENNVDVLIWPKTDPRFDRNRVEKSFHNIKITHEYVIVCFKNKNHTNFNKIKLPFFINNQWIESYVEMETILKGLGTTSSAKDEIAEIFGNRNFFQTPKPMKLIKEFVRAASKPDSIILDFFAGSGTTGHAVMDLNKEDNGNRLFILVNNNERNICREITYERLKWAIDKETYFESLKYYKLVSDSLFFSLKK